MENEFTFREGLACLLLSNLQWDKSIPNNKEFYDNFFNRMLVWICRNILRIDVAALFKKVGERMRRDGMI